MARQRAAAGPSGRAVWSGVSPFMAGRAALAGGDALGDIGVAKRLGDLAGGGEREPRLGLQGEQHRWPGGAAQLEVLVLARLGLVAERLQVAPHLADVREMRRYLEAL